MSLYEETTPPGAGIINLSWLGTGVYVALAIVATISPDSYGVAAATASLVLFAIGCVVFLWAYGIAVQRSRTDLIGIGGLYFLAGSAPNTIRFRLLVPLTIEVVVAIVTSSIRLYTPLAFGFLVPVFGLGLAGLWGARNGTFPPRTADDEDRGRKDRATAADDDGEADE